MCGFSRAGYARARGRRSRHLRPLPLALKVWRKSERIVRVELDEAGALELLRPALLPAAYFQETNPKQSEMVGLSTESRPKCSSWCSRRSASSLPARQHE
jgi:hypothetical protein